MNRSHTKLYDEINTVDREIFALQIIHPLNFRVKKVRWFCNVVHICVLIFCMFNFCRSACGRKYFNGENSQSTVVAAASDRANMVVENPTCQFWLTKAHFCISAYFRILLYLWCHLERQWIEKLYGKAYSMSSLWGTEHAFSFNCLLYRELVTTVNIPVQKKNATCRIVVSTKSSTP